eukprot:2633509-Amphidinium_carterae.1
MYWMPSPCTHVVKRRGLTIGASHRGPYLGRHYTRSLQQYSAAIAIMESEEWTGFNTAIVLLPKA